MPAPDGVEQIVETKHTDGVPAEVLAIREINVGIYAFTAGELFDALDAVREVDGERYLTGVFPVPRERRRPITAHGTADVSARRSEHARRPDERGAAPHAADGAPRAGRRDFVSPQTTTIEAGVEIGPDTTIAQGVTLHAGTRIGAGCEIGPHTTLIGPRLGDGVWVAHSYPVDAEVQDGASRPFAYLRPGTVVREGAKIGTFVEVKIRHLRGHEGPAPLVPRRRGRRRAVEHRAGNVTATTTAAQAPHQDRKSRENQRRHDLRRPG